MGLDVGVVKISYLERPEKPPRDFLWQLVLDAGCEYWGGVWEGNGFVEIERRRMLAKARKYIKRKSMTQEDSEKLVSWLKGLPWDGGTIMLHLNW